MNIKELHKKTGVGFSLCKLALEYAKNNEEIAIAYIKAKTLAISTPNLTFDERVKTFMLKSNKNSMGKHLNKR